MYTLTTEQAIHILQHEGIVAIPTETVYGLAARADSEIAVEKVYVAKQRPRDNPLICHFTSLEMIDRYIPDLPISAKLLLDMFAPGPISVLVPLPKNSLLLPATGGRDSVICRIPNHPLALQIIQAVGVPLAAPSANTSGKYSGTTAEMVMHDLGNRIGGVVDGGPCMVGLESTIIDCRESSRVTILRPGVLGVEDIQPVLDEAYRVKACSEKIMCVEANAQEPKETTPGMKYRHYAPHTPVYPFVLDALLEHREKKHVVIGTDEALLQANLPSNTKTISLSSHQNMPEVARRFYQSLYILDTLHADAAYIIFNDWPNNALGKALKNRVEKMLVYSVFE